MYLNDTITVYLYSNFSRLMGCSYELKMNSNQSILKLIWVNAVSIYGIFFIFNVLFNVSWYYFFDAILVARTFASIYHIVEQLKKIIEEKRAVQKRKTNEGYHTYWVFGSVCGSIFLVKLGFLCLCIILNISQLRQLLYFDKRATNNCFVF